jgi:hypothetical protein
MLKVGDILLYSGRGPLSWAVKVKTWSDISHVELYIGAGLTVSARAEGVRYFPFTDKDLVEVWAPEAGYRKWDFDSGLVWFNEQAHGQAYDVWGLLRFFRIGQESIDKQFCSEVVTRTLRAGGFEPFTPQTDADQVSPGMFRTSPRLRLVVDARKQQ